MSRGAFVDPKGVRWDTNDADYEGYLCKQSRWVREWRKRYFILKGSKVFYSKSATTAPHGMIDLVDCISVKSAEAKTRKRNALEISTSNEVIYMYADSEREKDGWIGAIGKAIVKHSSMLINDEDCDGDADSGSEGSVA
mmetsp:Transcript_16320/g.24590  ORF Transcript_16320/g.24590 Transcript_16320/m.24590 type:complete len:139 (-) Transcript_16320:149-565(-)|eukprot:CAMPEP_0185018572 /NCGR_PEP_ID=MMETSP1103-20130426/1247_1 /TAXON_ID=36769 /ORGANISM="Paraphysomonas bandaiensis, Strain Caron Lab Isolate" /LENGTH=138 /DNA_ID=CAMNT_0027548417 /DNA_START=62 /DNA_END=478 /DNA_ORIENTATION=+